LVSPSARVVYAALAGNLAVAAAKFGASALSGSSAMLTEAIHSLVDSADQILLLTGQSRARKPGPQAILMALTLRFRSELSIPALDDAIREITSTLQSVEKRVAYVYVRPGPNGGALAEANPPDIRDIAFRAD